MNLTWIVYKKQFPLNCNYPRKFLENSNFLKGIPILLWELEIDLEFY